MVYVFFVLGFFLLIKGADWLVEGAVFIAKRFKVSDLVIGMTIVAFGTSAPELVVNLLASFSGNPDIATGNVLGSNVANILLVVGIAALLSPMVVHPKIAKRDLPFSIAILVLLAGLAFNFSFGFLQNQQVQSPQILSRLDGIVLVLVFGFFIWYSFKKGEIQPEGTLENIKGSTPKAVVKVLAGLGGLALGGDWIVAGAVQIAKNLGMSEALIGLTIVAVGTSLPEVAASVAAALKKNADLAMGNVIGSNIFNVLWVLGVSAVVNPISFPMRALQDTGLVVLASALVVVLLFMPAKYTLGRASGAIALLAYSGYIYFLILRDASI
jgi:cation:H+ antiporter